MRRHLARMKYPQGRVCHRLAEAGRTPPEEPLVREEYSMPGSYRALAGAPAA